MKPIKFWKWRVLIVGVTLPLLSGCESSDSATVHTHSYYGASVYDPWYHGDVNYDNDVVVTPPDRNPRPTHPIAHPPGSAGPRPTPAPSIPHAAPRGGGGGGRRR